MKRNNKNITIRSILDFLKVFFIRNRLETKKNDKGKSWPGMNELRKSNLNGKNAIKKYIAKKKNAKFRKLIFIKIIW